MAWGWEYFVFSTSPSACCSAFNPSAVLLPVDYLSCILNVAPLNAPRVRRCRAMSYFPLAFQRRKCLPVHLIYRCITDKFDDVIPVRCTSNVGLDRTFGGSHTERSARQRAFFLHQLSHEPLLLGQSLLCVSTALG